MAFHVNGYSNFHDDNQDWIISKIKSIEDTEAHTGELAEAAQASADASQASAVASQLSANASESSAGTSQYFATQASTSAQEAEASAELAAEHEAAAKNYADNIADPVAGIVADWLDDNITPTTPIVDESLSISGAAADAKVTGDAINYLDNVVSNIATSETVKSDNLWDISTNTEGYQLDTSGQPVESANYTITDYIEIEPSSTYWTGIIYNGNVYSPVAQRICFYDDQKAFVSKTGPTTANVGTFEAPANIKYLRMAVNTANFFGNDNDTAMLIKSNAAPAEYVPYFEPYINSELNSDIIPYDDIKNKIMIESSPLYGKNVSWYGDSILKNIWWNDISTLFNMVSTNNGVGGTKISGTAPASLCQATRINGQYDDVVDPNTGEITVGGVAIPNDAEFIIIGAGTNDWAQNIALGDKNIQYDSSWEIVEDVQTFYQACHVMFRRLSELRPNAKIIVLGTPFGKMVNRSSFTNKYGLLNNQGLTSLDYGNALCDVAEMWGHHAIRYGNIMGVNDSNVETLLDPNGDGHLHPTTDTAKEMFRKATLNELLKIKYI